MPTSFRAYSPISAGPLSISNINVAEVDVGTTDPFTTTANFLFGTTNGSFSGLNWLAFDTAVTGAGSSETLTITFNVAASPGNVISEMDSLYTVDQFNGAGGHVTAIESAYDASGNLLGIQYYTYGQVASGPIVLSSPQQNITVTVALTESIDSTGSAASAVDMSGLQALFAQSAAPPATASIGDIVFLDMTGSGLETGFDNGPGVPGVTVELLNGPGTSVLETTTTNSSGRYSFTGLAAGTYEVEFVAPTGYTISPQGIGGNPAINSSPDQSTGITGPITLTAGEADHDVEAGIMPPGTGVQGTASLGDYVWFDANANGLVDGTETGVAGVTVDLLSADGSSVIETTTTNSAGFYSFTNLNPGSYEVQFVAPTGYAFTLPGVGSSPALDSSPNSTTGITAPISLTAGQIDNNVEAGLTGTAALGDYVWFDANLNGLQDGTETGVAGVTVDLLNAAGTATLAATTTDSTGHYSFTNLAAGSYEVQFVAPAGDAFSAALQGGNAALDSTPNATSGITAPVTLAAGQTDTTIDAGVHGTAALGDYVWFDSNLNGLQDGTETGVAGVTVDLLNAAGNATVAVTMTDSTGHYSFTNLAAGSYEVMFVAPAGDAFSAAVQGSNAALDSNANVSTGITAPITLVAGQTDTTIDAGVHGTAALGDYVWFDSNVNGMQDGTETGVAGVTVDLLSAAGTVTLAVSTTDSTGHYSFTNLAAGSYEVMFVAPAGDALSPALQGSSAALDSNPNATSGITAPVTLAAGQTDTTIDAGVHGTAALGDYVWFDSNLNGMQDGTETGVAGVTVDLLNAAGTATLAVTTTDSTGLYTFINLAAGSYEVMFVAPAGDAFSAAVQGGNAALDSNPNATSGITAPVTLAAGQTDTTIDAGVHGTAALGDYVWFDSNLNGLQDATEIGVAGVTVDLLNAAGTATLAVTTTDSTGHYSFTNLAAGSYDVQFVAPTGDAFSPALQGSNAALDSNANVSTGITAPITLVAGQTDTTIDAGVHGTAALGDYVWFDSNVNGMQDGTETGVAGVTVDLLSAAGTATLAVTTTDSTGHYSFTNLDAGNYEVQFVAPTGDAFSAALQGSNAAIDSNPNATSGITAPVTLAAGQTDSTIDAGVHGTAALGDYVWFDSNLNGLQDGTETGVAGVTVDLLNAAGTATLAVTTTDSTGHYSFTNLAAGSYEVMFVAPAGDAFSAALQGGNAALNSNPNATSGITAPVTLAAGQTDTTIDAGMHGTAALGDYVWFDSNQNGMQDGSENGVGGVIVDLLNAAGTTTLAVTTTDSTGHYSFTNLAAGSYEVKFIAPAGDAFSAALQGGNAAVNSNPNATSGITAPVTLAAGQTDTTIDAGVHGTAALGDYVWFDSNLNGLQDSTETGVAGVTVDLLNATGSTTLAVTTTDSTGHYSFTNLAAGSYEVKFVAPTGDAFSPALQGSNAAVNSNPNATSGITAPVSLAAGQTDNTIDAGVHGTGALGDYVWFDSNLNGLQDGTETGVAGVTVDLLNAAGTSTLAVTTTDSTGHYSFTNLAAGSYEVKFVAPTGDAFSPALQGSNAALDSNPNATSGITAPVTLTAGQTDSTIDAGVHGTAALGDYVWFDSNLNGLQDSTETGVAGVTVDLLNAAGTATLAVTTTDSIGHYTFINLAAGSYEVKFVAPTGDAFSPALQGSNAALDSNANGSTGITAPITLAAGQTDTTIDAGVHTLATAALGDYVWWDVNGNGLQDATESGIAGVTVDLLNSSGISTLAVTTTDSAGHYSFANLAAGSYELKFIAPTGDVFSAALQGSNAALNSNPNATTGITNPVTLTAGQTDNTIDAGLKGTASLGNFVWLDTNANGLQDSNEKGMAGVTVDLLNATGTSVLAVTTTDSNGNYSFSNLLAGTYEVKFVAPSGETFSPQSQGTNGAINSNPNPATGTSAPITLTAGQINTTIDAGLHPTSGLSVLKQPCKVVVNSCGQVSYSFQVTDTGATPLTNISIKDNIGTASAPDYVIPTAVTSGGYNVGDTNHNGALDPGETWQYTETVNQIACTPGTSGSVSHTATGSNLGAGCTAWLSSSFNPVSCKDGATYVFQGISCTITGSGVGSKPIIEQCPDACITFSSSCTQPTTTFDSGRNCWVTTLPANCNPGSVFLSGLPLTVPSGCNLSNCNVTWSINDSSNNCNASAVSWDATCTGFSSFNQNGCNGTSNYNQIGVKVCDNNGGYGNGGSCSQGYGWNGSSYSDTGSGYGGSGYSNGSGYGAWGYGGYNACGWIGSNTDDAGTPENQFTLNNCASGSYTVCSIGNGCGSSGGTNSCGDDGTANSSGSSLAPLTAAQFNALNGCNASYGPSAAATFTSGPFTVTSGTASQLLTGPKASSANSVLLVVSASSTSIAALGSQTIELSFNGQLITFNAANFASSSAEGFPSNISGLANGTVNGLSFSSTLHAGADFVYASPLSSAGGTGSSLGSVVITSPINLRVDVFGDQNGVIIDNAANSGAEGVTGVAGTGGSPGITGAADTVVVTATTTSGSTVTASDTKEVQVLASNSNVNVDCAAPTSSLSGLFGTSQTLEFTYNPGNTVATRTAGIATVAGTNSNSLAFIEISNNTNPLAAGATIYFEGAVTSGEKIYADATTNIFSNLPNAAPNNHFDTTAGADIYAYVYKSQADFTAGAAPVQTIAYNASGSQAMYANDMIGSLKLVGFVGSKGGYLAS